MAICTLQGHVSRAIDFYKKSDMYFGIGKTTPWSQEDLGESFNGSVDYETHPPVPKNTDSMIDIVGFKRVESKFIVVQDNTGELEYRGTKWKIVSEEEAPRAGARWVYISTYLSYNELPTDVVYRQVGVFSGLTRTEGVSTSKYVLLPSEVENVGLLEVLDNRKPVYRDNDIREHLKLIIEF